MWQTSACLSSLMGSNDPMRPNEDTSEGSSNGSKDVTVVTQLAASIDEHCQNISGSHCCGCAMISGVNQGDKKPSLATRHQREKEKGGGGVVGRQAGFLPYTGHATSRMQLSRSCFQFSRMLEIRHSCHCATAARA